MEWKQIRLRNPGCDISSTSSDVTFKVIPPNTNCQGTMAAILWVVIRVTRDVTIASSRPVPQLLGCLFAAEKDVTSGIWLAPLTVETVIFLLTSLKAFQHCNSLLNLSWRVLMICRAK